MSGACCVRIICRLVALPVACKIHVNVDGEVVVCDCHHQSLVTCTQEVLPKPFDRVAMFHFGICREPSTLMRCIGNVRTGTTVEVVELANDTAVVEVTVK